MEYGVTKKRERKKEIVTSVCSWLLGLLKSLKSRGEIRDWIVLARDTGLMKVLSATIDRYNPLLLFSFSDNIYQTFFHVIKKKNKPTLGKARKGNFLIPSKPWMTLARILEDPLLLVQPWNHGLRTRSWNIKENKILVIQYGLLMSIDRNFDNPFLLKQAYTFKINGRFRSLLWSYSLRAFDKSKLKLQVSVKLFRMIFSTMTSEYYIWLHHNHSHAFIATQNELQGKGNKRGSAMLTNWADEVDGPSSHT